MNIGNFKMQDFFSDFAVDFIIGCAIFIFPSKCMFLVLLVKKILIRKRRIQLLACARSGARTITHKSHSAGTWRRKDTNYQRLAPGQESRSLFTASLHPCVSLRPLAISFSLSPAAAVVARWQTPKAIRERSCWLWFHFSLIAAPG